jgi:hypothetical protein
MSLQMAIQKEHGAKGRIGTGLVLGAPIAGATLTTLAAWSTARRISAPGPRDNLYTSGTQEAGQSHAEAAAAFDAGALQRSELLHPSHQRGVAGLCRGHALVTEAPTVAVEGYRDVYVGMCVYTQDDERLLVLVDRQEVHRSLLSLEKPALSLCTHQPRRWTVLR